MTIYERLQKSFQEKENALDAQLRLLAKAASLVENGFGAFLGLTASRWTDHNGKAGDPYVQLGVGREDQFKPVHWVKLSSYGGVVEFSLALTLTSDDYSSRTTYVFPMSAQCSKSGYVFQFEDGESVEVGSESAKAGRFDKVWAGIVVRLEKALDPSKVILPE